MCALATYAENATLDAQRTKLTGRERAARKRRRRAVRLSEGLGVKMYRRSDLHKMNRRGCY
jgi:hypothetical protein